MPVTAHSAIPSSEAETCDDQAGSRSGAGLDDFGPLTSTGRL